MEKQCHIPNDRSRVPKSVPRDRSQTEITKIRRVVKRITDYQKLQRRYKRVRIRIRVNPDAQTHGFPLSTEKPLVIRRHSISVIVRGVHHAPESPVNHLIENRGRIRAVDPSVEVGGPDQVLGAAVHGDDVAELLVQVVLERE